MNLLSYRSVRRHVDLSIESSNKTVPSKSVLTREGFSWIHRVFGWISVCTDYRGDEQERRVVEMGMGETLKDVAAFKLGQSFQVVGQ